MATQDVNAWTFTNGYPNSLKLSKIEVPRANESESAGTPPQMLVRIKAAALNPVDIQRMNLPTYKIPLGSNQDPKGTGCDFSGTVVAGGGPGFQQGDDVFGLTMGATQLGSGTLAEMARFDMAASVIVKKPPKWSHEQAAAISLVWLTAKACVDGVAPWVDAAPGKRVAILGGSSATGSYSVKLAKRRGWKVISTSSARNRDFILSTLGADRHVDYTAQDVRSAVADFHPDAVIDCVGGTDCVGLPTSSRYVTIVGDKTGRATMGGPYTYYDYLAPVRAATQWIRWARGRVGLGEKYDIIFLDTRTPSLQDAVDTLAPDDIYIDSVFAFDDAKKAFERLNTGRAKGKVVVRVA